MVSRRTVLASLSAAPLLAAGESLTSLEHRVFQAINFQRVSAYGDPLIWQERLSVTAREHSRRMLDAGFFGHEDPRFGDLRARLARAEVAWWRCGENVFREKDYTDPVSIAVVSWMYSEGHRQNLLNPEFTYSGVGVATDGNGTYTVTQQFLTPLSFTQTR